MDQSAGHCVISQLKLHKMHITQYNRSTNVLWVKCSRSSWFPTRECSDVVLLYVNPEGLIALSVYYNKGCNSFSSIHCI